MATSTIKDSTKEEKKTKTSKTTVKSKAKGATKKSPSKQKKQNTKSHVSKKVNTTTKNTSKVAHAKTSQGKTHETSTQIASLSQDSHADINNYEKEDSNDLKNEQSIVENIQANEAKNQNEMTNDQNDTEQSQEALNKDNDIEVQSQDKAQSISSTNLEPTGTAENFIIKPADENISHESKDKVTSLWLNDDIKDEVNVINQTTDEKNAKSVVLDSALAASVASNNSVKAVSSSDIGAEDVKAVNADEIDSTTVAKATTVAKSATVASATATTLSTTSTTNTKASNSDIIASTTGDTTSSTVDFNKPIIDSEATNKSDKSSKSEENTEDSKQQDSDNSKDNSTENNNLNVPNSAVVTLSNSTKNNSNQEGKFNKKLLIPLILSLFAFLGVLIYQYYIKNINYVTPYPDEKVAETQDGNAAVPTGSKDYENPINGVYFSNEEAAKFKDKKPVAIMVNNHEQARPSYGLSKADVVYEAVAEGGITRLMPIYHSQIPELVESIRSARYYFVELASGYKAHFFHWGGAHVPACQKLPHDNPNYCPPINGKVETNPKVDAYDRIVELGLPNLDGGNYACKDDAPSCAFGRDEKRVKAGYPIEHTAFVRVPLALELAKEIRPDASWHKYIPIVAWKFKDDAPLEERGDIGIDPMISYYYWKTPSAYAVDWKYDKDQNNYIRYQGKVKQVDASNDQELRAKVVIIRFTDEEPVGDKKNHLYHKIVGTGDALIFQDGKVIKAKWNRDTHEDRDVYTDEDGNQIEFNRGQIWIQLVPTGNPVTYEPKQPTLQVEGTGNDQDTENNNNNSDNNGETTDQNTTDTKTESTNSEPAQQ